MYWAHSARKGYSAQLYQDHVRGVVDGAMANLARWRPLLDDEQAKVYASILSRSAALHDLGKLAADNQAILAGKKMQDRLKIEHRDAGVKYLLGDQYECPEATLIYAHHKPGLPNLLDEKLASQPFRFSEARLDTDTHLSEYLQLHQALAGELPERLTSRAKLTALEYRLLLSALVDADYSDSAGGAAPLPLPRWPERRLQLDRYVAMLPQDGERNALRRALYACVQQAPAQWPLTYCDAPVGTGKTTVVMAYALKTAEECDLRHIFVVVPYTNIISQTVKVLRQALVLPGEVPEAIVAEHHHQADFESPAWRQLATTWSAPIIVTTAVQFFETIASNQPAKLRKLHQLPASMVILDEYHTALPMPLLPMAWRWLTQMSADWGCHFALCSATAPKFWLEKDLHEILREQMGPTVQVEPLVSEEVANQLNSFEANRVRLNVWHEPIQELRGMAELAALLNQAPGPRIVVLNTIVSAACLANYLRQHGHDVLHLSTALTPTDRDMILEEIDQRLAQKKSDWTLVATSCVECGLDLSFRSGFCQQRSLASFLQLSGRIGRNGEYPLDATLTAFTIIDDAFTHNSAFNNSISAFDKLIASPKLPTMTFTQAVTTAFGGERQLVPTELYEDWLKREKVCDFAEVAAIFRVIEDETVTVIADTHLAQKLLDQRTVTPHEMQRGSVNIRRELLNKLHLADAELPMLRPEQYDHFLGYMKTLV